MVGEIFGEAAASWVSQNPKVCRNLARRSRVPGAFRMARNTLCLFDIGEVSFNRVVLKPQLMLHNK